MLAAMEACTENKTSQINKRIVVSPTCSLCHSTTAMKYKPLGLRNWITRSSLKMLTSSIAGMAFTPTLFKVLCNRLSSVVVALWTAFFFLFETCEGRINKFQTKCNPSLLKKGLPHCNINSCISLSMLYILIDFRW